MKRTRRLRCLLSFQTLSPAARARVGDARFEPCPCNSFLKAIKDLETGIDELQTKIEERKNGKRME